MTAPWKKIKKDIDETANCYVLAVSGGVDSMFGLNFFKDNLSRDRFVVAHFDHQIREDSWEDCQLIKNFCDNHGISMYWSKGENITSEVEARNQRYDFLYRIKGAAKADKIVTFHHSDDQVETILLNLMRGRPHHKLAMEKYGESIYRPFLEISKEDILKEAIKRGVSWREDSTNSDTKYERNWLRNEVIPMLNKRRNISKSILKGLLT